MSVVGLGAAAALHGAWARGSSWPAPDRDQLCDLVVGRRPFPSSAATWGVTALLTGATSLAAVRTGVVPLHFPGLDRPVRIGSNLVVSVLLLRGAGGLVVAAVGRSGASTQFLRWDARLYSPLCLVLAASLALGARAEQA